MEAKYGQIWTRTDKTHKTQILRARKVNLMKEKSSRQLPAALLKPSQPGEGENSRDLISSHFLTVPEFERIWNGLV
jgi:hypothetical protein